jgi:DNA-binding PadR family transcriptional regulator
MRQRHSHSHSGRDREHDREWPALHALWHAIGRGHHGRHGGGRFPGGFGGGSDFGGSDDGMPRGRKFSSDDLQLILLALLADEPRHGYELIKALEVRSNGFYSPSPGMVYPALTYLEELGFATVEAQGNRKRYALSDAGRDYLATNRERVDFMLAKITHFAKKMDSVRRAFAGREQEDANGEDGAWLAEYVEARHALRRALVLRSDATPDEQKRIAAILKRATVEIEGLAKDASSNTPEV